MPRPNPKGSAGLWGQEFSRRCHDWNFMKTVTMYGIKWTTCIWPGSWLNDKVYIRPLTGGQGQHKKKDMHQSKSLHYFHSGGGDSSLVPPRLSAHSGPTFHMLLPLPVFSRLLNCSHTVCRTPSKSPNNRIIKSNLSLFVGIHISKSSISV